MLKQYDHTLFAGVNLVRRNGVSLPRRSGVYFTRISGVSLNGISNNSPIGIKQEKILIENITIYPNPVYDVLTIKFPVQNDEVFIEIENMLGQKVYEGRAMYSPTTINLKQMESGIYLIKVYNKRRLIETKKFIKE